jgi:hypothetical protein
MAGVSGYMLARLMDRCVSKKKRYKDQQQGQQVRFRLRKMKRQEGHEMWPLSSCATDMGGAENEAPRWGPSNPAHAPKRDLVTFFLSPLWRA